MKRPIVTAIIGYIIGIIMGLYFNKSIVLIYFPIIAIYFIYKVLSKTKKRSKKEKLKIVSVKRYFRYIKIYFNSNVLILIIVISIISNTITINQNKKYMEIYNSLSNKEDIIFTGIIISNIEEKQYSNKYKIQTKYNNKKIKFYITTDKKTKLEYGDKVTISGQYIEPKMQRNYKGFDYSQYLKQLKIYGTIKCEKVKIIDKNQANKIFQIANNLSETIKSNVKEILTEEESSILFGLILGDKSDIDEQIQENFTNASMSHILAVSGMHVAYVIFGVNLIFKNIIGKRATNILNILILVFYMFITNFSPSITRAGIMGIIMLFSKIIYRKNDIYTSISISLILILIYNPFLIQNLGLQLSYGGVIGIIFFNKQILKFLKNLKVKNKFYKYKIRPRILKYIDKIKDIISISISVQITILPIIIFNLNTFNPYFLISNFFLSILIGPIVIVGFIFVILTLVNIKIATMILIIVKISINILLIISKVGELPLAKIYIATPSLFSIIIYFVSIIVLFSIFNVYSAKYPNKTQIRVKNLIALIKIKIRQNRLNVKRVILFLILILLLINFIPKDLKIYFIDVGQGDSTLIVTPNNKTILIDGGGSESLDYDIGKNTLIPYILDRGFTKIDTVIISHFDNDHVDGILSLMRELKIGKIYISKQTEISENYKEFLEIVNQKNIDVYEVISGNRIFIEKNLYFDILWPTNKQITTNVLNNNAIVCNLHYKDFSMLFTGDIEEIAEEEIVKLYSKNKHLLKADILKVGHHGSKTSSTDNFLNLVIPQIAVVGVGKNNKFGHPNEGVLDRLKQLNCKIFRTDLNGEILIQVDINRNVKIKSKINCN